MRNYKIKILDIGLFLVVIKNFLDGSAIITYSETVDNIIVSLVCICFIYVIISQGYSLKTLLFYFVIGLLCIYSSIRCGYMLIAITVITCMAIRTADFDKIISKLYQWQKMLLFLHSLLAIVMYAVGVADIYGYYDSGSRFRINLGFSHPNTLAIYMLNLVLMSIWLKYEVLNRKKIILYMLNIVIIWIITDSNTMLLTGLLAILLVMLSIKFQTFEKISFWVACFITPMLFLTMTYLISTYTDGNKLSHIMNLVLNSRVMLGAYMYTHLGTSILGQHTNYAVKWDLYWGITSMSADSAYTSILITNGWIWILLICVAFILLARKHINKINIMIIIWAFYAVTEVHVLDGIRFFPMLLITLLLNDDNNRYSKGWKKYYDKNSTNRVIPNVLWNRKCDNEFIPKH